MSYTRPAVIDTASIPKKQLLKILDKEYDYAINNLCIRCTVEDFKTSYGKLRLQITPVEGTGSTWVEPADDQLQELLDEGNLRGYGPSKKGV